MSVLHIHWFDNDLMLSEYVLTWLCGWVMF